MSRRPNPLPHARALRALRLLDQGRAPQDVAAELGVSPSSVYRWRVLRMQRLPIRGPAGDDEVALWAQDYAAGMGTRGIAAKYGRGEHHVSKRLRASGVVMKPSGGVALVRYADHEALIRSCLARGESVTAIATARHAEGWRVAALYWWLRRAGIRR